MGETGESEPPKRRLIGEEDKARFLRSLRCGASREEAAAAAGFPLGSLYNVRARESVFRLAWEWALDLACIDVRGGRLAPGPRGGGEVEEAGPGEVRIVSCNRRLLRRRRMRWVKFNEKRQQIFLDHFAGTADAEAAAAAAGVTYQAVRAHYRKHPEFAALWHEALRLGYAMLEAEAVRQRLEAQRRLSENLEPTGELAQEFDRVMKLLARWDRRDGRIGAREVGHGHQQSWTCEEAVLELDRSLRKLGLRTGIVPPDEEAA
jgi:hypothetical protein